MEDVFKILTIKSLDVCVRIWLFVFVSGGESEADLYRQTASLRDHPDHDVLYGELLQPPLYIRTMQFV